MALSMPNDGFAMPVPVLPEKVQRESDFRQLVASLAGVTACATMVLAAPVARAAAGDPFPSGPRLVFVAQGPARGEPTTLYQATQETGNIVFVRRGTAAIGYNAVGCHEADRYLWGINDNNGLVRIGQQGATTVFGQVGLPSSSANYNQGAFGEGAAADTLYVRLAKTDRRLYAIAVNTRTSRAITLAADVPNLSDFTWAQGYLWGVYGEGGRMYRIDPASGAVLSFRVTGLRSDPYGAQWTYGNGTSVSRTTSPGPSISCS